MHHYRLVLCLPELYMLAVIGILLIQSLVRTETDGGAKSVNWVPVAAFIGIIVSALCLVHDGIMFWGEHAVEAGETFWGAYRVDSLSQFFKLAVSIGFFITTLNGLKPPALGQGKRPDYFLFLALSAWGLMLLASAVELITIYVALEISSYSLYAIIPLRSNDKRAAEAGIKYIMFGAVATAIALYGYSYILASQHTSYISELASMDWSWAGSPMAVVGMSLFLCGMFFKLALFPFHFWCPDVYEGTGNETAAFVATLPKLGAVVILVRMAAMLKPGMEITNILAVFGAISMTFGNLVALAQKDLKRMLGFSSIAHAGYVMLGLVAGKASGLAAASFYILVYLLMNLTCFWVICRISKNGENVSYDDLDGLYKREPVMAFVLAVSAFALVGLPPTAGFMGKLFLLNAAWNTGYNWLVIVAVLNTAIAIYYYLGMVRHAYTHDGNETVQKGVVSTVNLFWGSMLAATVLFLGALPYYLFDIAVEAGKQLLP